MTYLDYAATTPVDPRILQRYLDDCVRFFANANSTHSLGLAAEKAGESASESILRTLKLDNHEVVYTSGASEANNLAIKGIALKQKSHGKHLITSNLEHSSVTSCFSYLQNLGYEIDVIETDATGRVSTSDLEAMIRQDTVLVSIGAVNSETGIMQNVSEIAKMLKKYPKIVFHSDMTQLIGKIELDLEGVDLITLSGHKLYGLKGIGALIKRRSITLIPTLHGGKSTTPYRSGTPAIPMYLSLALTLELAFQELDFRFDKVKELNAYLIEKLSKFNKIVFNSNEFSLPNFVNVSVLGHDQKAVQRALDDNDIFVSTQTACASEKPYSAFIYHLTGDRERSESSIRISMSHLTTLAEIDKLIDTLSLVVK
ncbi:MAG: cysteine desulfurase [Bacilli bacterium]|nr:cysteine desulfurase [Bacilli bacterium]MBN2696807.1 cysteine desulfurase [Bacilli bacterium]